MALCTSNTPGRKEAAPTVWLTWGSVLAVGFWCLLKLEIPLTENLVLTQVPSWTKKKTPAVWESLHGDGKEFGKAFTDTGTIPVVFFLKSGETKSRASQPTVSEGRGAPKPPTLSPIHFDGSLVSMGDGERTVG